MTETTHRGHEDATNHADLDRFSAMLNRRVKSADEPWAQEYYEHQVDPEHARKLFALTFEVPDTLDSDEDEDLHRFDAMLGLAPVPETEYQAPQTGNATANSRRYGGIYTPVVCGACR